MKKTVMPSRSAPMKRSPIRQRAAVYRDVATASVKPKRKCANPECRHPFEKRSMTHVACSPDCALIVGRLVQAKIERKKDRVRKDDIQPVKVLLKRAEKAVNRYVRLRDRFDGCISCNKPSHWDGVWHASHFKSVGSNSVLRYNLLNINKSCNECNFFMAGNIVEYEKKLILKIGTDRVDWLKCQNGVRRYDAEYLIRLTRIFNKKARRLEKRRLENAA